MTSNLQYLSRPLMVWACLHYCMYSESTSCVVAITHKVARWLLWMLSLDGVLQCACRRGHDFGALHMFFSELVQPDLISIFNENELELLISGMPTIDLADLKANTTYHGCGLRDAVIQWLWNILHSLSQEEVALFVQFVTGTSKVPLGGFKDLQGMRGPQLFNIHMAQGDTNNLPYVCVLLRLVQMWNDGMTLLSFKTCIQVMVVTYLVDVVFYI